MEARGAQAIILFAEAEKAVRFAKFPKESENIF